MKGLAMRINRVILITAFSLSTLCQSGLCAPQAMPKLIATITTDQTNIKGRSPVLVRMALQNQSAADLTLTSPSDELSGSASVQVKGPEDDSFRNLPTAYTGLVDAFGYRSSLKRGETIVAYVLLFTDAEGRYVFDKSGRYELRARMRAGEAEAFSEAIAIKVKPARGELRAKSESLQEDLAHVSPNEALDPQRQARLTQGLDGLKQYRKILLLAEAITGIHSSDRTEQARGAAKLEELSDPQGSLWSELATAMLAHHYARTGAVQQARRLLIGLPRSSITDETLKLLESTQ